MASDNGRLTKETQSALIQTTQCVKDQQHILCGGIKYVIHIPRRNNLTDEPEYRFRLYRRQQKLHIMCLLDKYMKLKTN